MTADIESAIAYYHDLLQDGRWQDTHEQVVRDTEQRNLRAYGKLLTSVLRPRFVSPGQYAELRQASALVGRAVADMGDRCLVDAALRRRLQLTPDEEARALAEVNPVDPYARLDGFLGTDGVLRFLEYNSVPGGTRKSDEVGQLFDGLPIMDEFRKRYRTRYFRPETRRVPESIRAHQLRGGNGLPNVAVVASLGEGVTMANIDQFDTEAMYMLPAALEAGIGVRMVAPEDIEYRDGALYSEDFRIDCVTYIDTYAVFAKAVPLTHPLWQAMRDNAAYFLGSFSLLLTRSNKALFALLTDPALEGMFDPEVRAAVRRHVLWTRVVREEKTDLHGEAIDLVPYLVQHRERFALKPANGQGGKGITLGWNVDGAAWEAALKQALARPYVVQERAHTSSGTYPLVSDGGLQMIEYNEDYNPFIWNAYESEGTLMRLSTSGMLNLQVDGTLVPLFLVEPA